MLQWEAKMDTYSALAFANGVIAGLRSLTAPAAVAWAAHLKWVDLRQTWAAFIASPVTLYSLTALALLELVGDKLPKTPSRKTPGPFAARIVMGALSGATLCTVARQPSATGEVLGGLGAVVGTLGGYQARTRLVKAWNVPDFVVALLEDAVAIAGGLFIVSRFG
jgi:uncharacterized membrane protein